LTGNQTPLVNILGERYASRSHLTTSRIVEELLAHIEFNKNCCNMSSSAQLFHHSCIAFCSYSNANHHNFYLFHYVLFKQKVSV